MATAKKPKTSKPGIVVGHNFKNPHGLHGKAVKHAKGDGKAKTPVTPKAPGAPTAVGPLSMLGEVKVQTVSASEASKFLPPPPPRRYQALFDTLRGLKADQSAVVTLPAEVDARKLIRRMAVMLNGEDIKAPAGHSFFKTLGLNNTIVVSVRPSRKLPNK